jgi:hypothetical protein
VGKDTRVGVSSLIVKVGLGVRVGIGVGEEGTHALRSANMANDQANLLRWFIVCLPMNTRFLTLLYTLSSTSRQTWSGSKPGRRSAVHETLRGIAPFRGRQSYHKDVKDAKTTPNLAFFTT